MSRQPDGRQRSWRWRPCSDSICCGPRAALTRWVSARPSSGRSSTSRWRCCSAWSFGLVAGWDFGAQYFAGYIVEKSLSVDNLFVFLIIMGTFAVPAEQQARALTIGIVAALVLRAIFIAAGAALLDAFSIMFLVFGLVLRRDRDPAVSPPQRGPVGATTTCS